MKVIGPDGINEYIEGTKTLKTSDHPIHQARIEMALGKGQWLYSPNRGHQLDKYKNLNQTPETVEAFQKELSLYLDKYSSEVRERLTFRGGISMSLTISKDALNV